MHVKIEDQSKSRSRASCGTRSARRVAHETHDALLAPRCAVIRRQCNMECLLRCQLEHHYHQWGRMMKMNTISNQMAMWFLVLTGAYALPCTPPLLYRYEMVQALSRNDAEHLFVGLSGLNVERRAWVCPSEHVSLTMHMMLTVSIRPLSAHPALCCVAIVLRGHPKQLISLALFSFIN